MTLIRHRIKSAVTAFVVLLATPAVAQNTELDPLFDALQQAQGPAAQEIEQKIWQEWSKSGSPAMDLLLQRGRDAMDEGNFRLAIEHFTALIDHAPEFAEGYNARATAYFQDGKYGPSLADIRETLRRNPRHFGALGGLGLILEELGEVDGALEAQRAVRALYPNREGLEETIRRLERQAEGQEI